VIEGQAETNGPGECNESGADLRRNGLVAPLVERDVPLTHADLLGESLLGQLKSGSDSGESIHGRNTTSAPICVSIGAVVVDTTSSADHSKMSESERKRGKVSDENQEEAARLREIWDRTYEERKVRGIHSQAAFGTEFGIGNQAAVGFFLSGKTALSKKAALGFARGLRCSVGDFSPRLAKEMEQFALLTRAEAEHLAAKYPEPLVKAFLLSEPFRPERPAPDTQAHPMSLYEITVPSTISWQEVERMQAVPARFTIHMPDDSLSGHIERGTGLIFERDLAPAPGKTVLVEDNEGHRFVRVFALVRGDHWQAQAKSPVYMPLDSLEHGLKVLATMRWREG
jgi:hypothetical protein